MTSNNQQLGRDRATHRGAPLDLDFLAQQTFDDLDLLREVLGLFVAQAQRIVPALPRMAAAEQREMAHRLSGSARGIGAWDAADAARAYEEAAPDLRPQVYQALATAFGAAVAAAQVAVAAR